MTSTTCPDGHVSASDDFCDECGLAMDGEASTAEPVGATLPPPESGPVGEGEVGRCPNCGTPRREGDAFCEVCGLDYATGALPEAPRSPLEPAPAVAAPPATTPGTWTVEVGVDPDWFAAQEAEGSSLALPAQRAPFVVDLTGALVAVGRRSASEGWYPGVDLGHVHDDPGVSRRHGEFVHADDEAGGDDMGLAWAWVDTGSTNGSVVDGASVEPHVQHRLTDGATIHLGAWTRLVVRAPDGAATAGEPSP